MIIYDDHDNVLPRGFSFKWASKAKIPKPPSVCSAVKQAIVTLYTALQHVQHHTTGTPLVCSAFLGHGYFL